MIKMVSGGGLGDAAMIFAALNSNESPVNPFTDNYIIDHVEVPDKLLFLIEGFYRYQKIKSQVFQINSWDWLKNNRSSYDYFVSTHWNGNDDFEKGWRINPFPVINYRKIDDIDVVVFPSAGRNGNRKFDEDSLYGFAMSEKRSRIVRHSLSDGDRKVLFVSGIERLVDVICSANVVIGHAGFNTFLAGMANKEVFMVPEKPASDMRKDPFWKVTEINCLEEINL